MTSLQFCNDVQDCMLTKEFIERWCKLPEKVKKQIPVKRVVEHAKENTLQIIPAKEFRGISKPSDTLFWCMLYLYNSKLYEEEIAFASYQREQELKYKMIALLNNVNEKEIQTHGYGNKRICKSKGLEPFLSVKEVIAELSGSKPMSLQGVSAWLAYCGVQHCCFAVMKYDTETLAIPVGTITIPELVCFSYQTETPIMILTRERNSWAITEQTNLQATIVSSFITALRPISNYSKDELNEWCSKIGIEPHKTKKDTYEAIQQWIHYRTCLLRNGFILYLLER